MTASFRAPLRLIAPSLPAVAFHWDADELGFGAAAEDQGSGADRGNSEGALQDRLGEETEG